MSEPGYQKDISIALRGCLQYIRLAKLWKSLGLREDARRFIQDAKKSREWLREALNGYE